MIELKINIANLIKYPHSNIHTRVVPDTTVCRLCSSPSPVPSDPSESLETA